MCMFTPRGEVTRALMQTFLAQPSLRQPGAPWGDTKVDTQPTSAAATITLQGMGRCDFGPSSPVAHLTGCGGRWPYKGYCSQPFKISLEWDAAIHELPVLKECRDILPRRLFEQLVTIALVRPPFPVPSDWNGPSSILVMRSGSYRSLHVVFPSNRDG